LSANKFLFLPQINPLKEDKYEKTDSNFENYTLYKIIILKEFYNIYIVKEI